MDIPRLFANLSVNYEMCNNCGDVFVIDSNDGWQDTCKECFAQTEFLIRVGDDITYKYHVQGGVLENMDTNTCISHKLPTLRYAVHALGQVYCGEQIRVL